MLAGLRINRVDVSGGCGDDKTIEQPHAPGHSLNTNAEADLNAKIEELKKKEMTVEVVIDGQSQGKWSQDGKGSWRLTTIPRLTAIRIYNADQKKGWSVAAIPRPRLDPSTMQMYERQQPAGDAERLFILCEPAEDRRIG